MTDGVDSAQQADERVGDDSALLMAAKSGDTSAFDLLVRTHTDRLYRVALRIVGDPAEAEDAVQDAWVSAWRSLSTFRGDSAAATWLYRVVTNAALSQIRKRRPTVPMDLTDEHLAPAGNTGNPEGTALREEETRRVHAAISRLEPSQRLPLVLRELEGMSYEEIAEVLEVNITALRARLHRARLALLAELKEVP
ncbi:RNA polymerase sigma-70 factor, ECF subfamily [Actinopolyspora xinjiangensis]|uniref:RNA polymerase sigma-70 factor, ECF subfamily n=1 Tax=Actinopolyspora xinjiangensis TaxID=405564 RepID=A0A1H0TLR7_9ACTN|nr:sigma-70 family RNA polymerase sigma factor [Actinopolyspora xinjiangensis]SDP54913.1 RNA polymerase sigma-70 factor, ECF subfamily [Actinopolyspora xinjiangensis]